MEQRILLHDGFKAEAKIEIPVPAHEVYRYWRDFTHLPEVIPGLQSVQVESPQKSHWVWSALRGLHQISWDSEIIEDLPDHVISWKTTETSEVHHAGSVWFLSLKGPDVTEVKVQMLYWPRGGKVVNWLETLMGDSPQQALLQGLARLKERLEKAH